MHLGEFFSGSLEAMSAEELTTYSNTRGEEVWFPKPQVGSSNLPRGNIKSITCRGINILATPCVGVMSTVTI
jgi:hypothetical protein